MSDENPRVAVCPGSYDPVTNGHLDVITRASRVFDKVVVGVVNNPVRKQKTLFTAEERRRFIEDATADAGNVEFGINQLNRKLAAEIESMYIFASANYSFLSSTGVKEIATFGGDVGDLVPAPVAKALAERLSR